MKYFLFLFIVFSSINYAKDTHILSIHSYNNSYPWTNNQQYGFQKALDTQDDLNPIYFSEYLDTKRKKLDARYESSLTNYMLLKYDSYTPDLIYVTDDDAMSYTVNNIKNIFPNVPVLYSGINNQSTIDYISKKLYVGIKEKKEIIPNIALIKRLFPNEKELLVIGDGSTTANTIHKDILNDSPSYNDVKIKYINTDDFKSVIQQIKNNNAKIAILSTVGGFHAKDGYSIPLKKVLKDIASTGILVFAMEDGYIQEGVIGGYSVDGINTGYEAGKLALTMLKEGINGEKAVNINPNSWIFDFQALKKHNIILPENIKSKSEFINKPISFYKSNEKLIISILYSMAAIIVLGTFTFLYYLYKSRKVLAKSEKELRFFITSLNKAQAVSKIGSWDWDMLKDYLWWSDQTYRIVGHEPQSFKADYSSFINHVHPEDVEKVENAINESIKGDGTYNVTHRMVQKDGSIRYVLEDGNVEYLDSKPVKMIGTMHDITEEIKIKHALEESEEKYRTLASIDTLTGIYNRYKFEELYALESERSRRFSTQLSIILFDIDNFKSVNDNYGHDVGDNVLIQLTNTLALSIRNIDIFSRWGGEEFLVMCPHTGLENARLLAEKLRNKVQSISFEEIDKLTISLGVSEFRADDTLVTLFKRADEALYSAKHNGRNQVVTE